MTKRLAMALVAGVPLVLAAASFGGWAVITVEDLPDHVVVGKPLALEFLVRQHGVTLLEGLHPRVEARSGDQFVNVAAEAGKTSGRYLAALSLPSAGDWTVTINSGFGPSKSTLMPIEAVVAGGKPSKVLAESDRGRRLFVAKGCFSCHVHKGVEATGIVADFGPELTHKRYEADYLRQFLANPEIGASRQSTAKMPNLLLRPVEIASLVAFLNADRRVASEP
jgi:hypothetical protein